MIKKCKICNKEFETTNRGYLVCSKKCRKENRKAYHKEYHKRYYLEHSDKIKAMVNKQYKPKVYQEKPCLFCEKLFKPKRSSSRHCSIKCIRKNNNKKNGNRNKRKK